MVMSALNMALSVSSSMTISTASPAPVIVAGMVFRAGLGVLARLAPTIQVFFVSQPLTILGGFLILMLGLSAGMLVWLDALQDYPLNLDPG
jgi:flagellar biosynthetic protein FliR